MTRWAKLLKRAIQLRSIRKMEAAALLLSDAVPPPPVVVNESHLC